MFGENYLLNVDYCKVDNHGRITLGKDILEEYRDNLKKMEKVRCKLKENILGEYPFFMV